MEVEKLCVCVCVCVWRGVLSKTGETKGELTRKMPSSQRIRHKFAVIST